MLKSKKIFLFSMFLSCIFLSCKDNLNKLRKNQIYKLTDDKLNQRDCQIEKACQILDEIKSHFINNKSSIQNLGEENLQLEAKFKSLVENLKNLKGSSQEDLYQNLALLTYREIIEQMKSYLPKTTIPVGTFFDKLIQSISKVHNLINISRGNFEEIKGGIESIIEQLNAIENNNTEEVDESKLIKKLFLQTNQNIASELKTHFNNLKEIVSLYEEKKDKAKANLKNFKNSFKGRGENFTDPVIKNRIIYKPYKDFLDEVLKILNNFLNPIQENEKLGKVVFY